MSTLYLTLGYPGAGKTTAAQAIHRLTGAVHLWADYERRQRYAQPTYSQQEHQELYTALNKQTDELLSQGQSVIFDTNFNHYKDRARLREIAARRGADTKLLWITTPKDIARARATTDTTGQHTRVLGDMPVEKFEQMAANLEPPRDNEKPIIVDGTRITDTYMKGLLA